VQILTENELVKIESQLVVPVIVGLMLRGQEPVDEIAEFTMHDMIGHMEPDTAALCIAFCAHHIAIHDQNILTSGALLSEATMIINDYASMWLDNTEGKEQSNLEVIEQLCNLPEDLDSLADLLDATSNAISNKHSTEGLICEILAIQAHAHRDYAESLLGVNTGCAAPKRTANIPHADNIIPFPGMF
jgi:hypothetical protein